ncbi:MAG: hypothetical protein WC860_05310 [Candidatus Margulisiibacteriota bacterium]|jgi:hypothetical protein
MEIYKNDYSKKEDETLWEIHEIRHKIAKKLKKMSIDEINSKAKKLLAIWKVAVVKT